MALFGSCDSTGDGSIRNVGFSSEIFSSYWILNSHYCLLRSKNHKNLVTSIGLGSNLIPHEPIATAFLLHELRYFSFVFRMSCALCSLVSSQTLQLFCANTDLYCLHTLHTMNCIPYPLDGIIGAQIIRTISSCQVPENRCRRNKYRENLRWPINKLQCINSNELTSNRILIGSVECLPVFQIELLYQQQQ